MTMDELFPKDIIICIYKIMHKEFVHEMNKEYRNCTRIYERSLYIRRKKTMIFSSFNYRILCGPLCKTGYDKMMKPVFTLPIKYIYSSGMSDPYGYKIDAKL